MPTNNTPIADTDGQPLMNTLSDLGVAPKEAYNVVQGVREMSGQSVIAEIRTQEAETRAQEALTRAQIAETRAEIAVLASKIDANTARIAALDSRLDGMGWTVSATLALVVALAAAGLLNWITRRWENSRSNRDQASG